MVCLRSCWVIFTLLLRLVISVEDDICEACTCLDTKVTCFCKNNGSQSLRISLLPDTATELMITDCSEVTISNHIASSVLREVMFQNIQTLHLNGSIQSPVLRKTVLKSIQDLKVTTNSFYEQEEIQFLNVVITNFPASSIVIHDKLKRAIFKNCTFEDIKEKAIQISTRNGSIVVFAESTFIRIEPQAIVISATHVAMTHCIIPQLTFLALQVSEATSFLLSNSSIGFVGSGGFTVVAASVSILHNNFSKLEEGAFKWVQFLLTPKTNDASSIMLMEGNWFNDNKLDALVVHLPTLNLLLRSRNTGMLQLYNNYILCDCALKSSSDEVADAKLFFYQSFQQNNYCTEDPDTHIDTFLENNCSDDDSHGMATESNRLANLTDNGQEKSVTVHNYLLLTFLTVTFATSSSAFV